MFFVVPPLSSFLKNIAIYKDKNNNKCKNKLVKTFHNMHPQYYIDIHKISYKII